MQHIYVFTSFILGYQIFEIYGIYAYLKDIFVSSTYLTIT